MDTLIRGTTPTIAFTFDTVDPANITVAYITIKSITNLNLPIVQISKSSAQIVDHTMSWTLPQIETLKLTAGDTVRVYCDWLTSGGTRGRSVSVTCKVQETGKDEVI